ncbi:MAG: hypothetical protein EA352_10190 [Gemmatimonadales bacterium]|nr:MAG: hypothetical protein EA352_10190 [Gemmatimonadales bacterium]
MHPGSHRLSAGNRRLSRSGPAASGLLAPLAVLVLFVVAACEPPEEQEEVPVAGVNGADNGAEMAGTEGEAAHADAPTWTPVADVPEARTEVSVTQLDDQVWMLGGFLPPEGDEDPPAATTLWMYDPATDSWEDRGEIPGGTHHAALVAVDGRLVLLGGYRDNTFEPVGRTALFDPETNSWTEGAPMPTPRGALAYAVLDGRVHTIGGTVADADGLEHDHHNTDAPDASVGTHEVYDPATDSWEQLPPMPTARNHHTAETTDDGRIVVTAGRAGRDFTMTATEIWDPVTGEWSRGADLPTGRSGVAAASLGGWIYVFGGETFDPGEARTFDEAERYDPVEDRWEELPPMPSARHGLGAAVVDGHIYVVSGGPGPGFTYGTANERLTP